jgi:arsenical pump membrane protein
MSELVAYSTFVITMGLAIGRPRVGPYWQVGPGAAASAGVAVMLAFRIVGVPDLLTAASTLWRPFLTIVAIMTMTAAARHLGVLDRVAEIVFRHPGLTTRQLFLCVFVLSACTASLLNNDAAVLLLTPVVVALVRRRYPGHRQLLMPFAFVVFMAAGVAPFVVSNPMNMIVAASAGLDFNGYAVRMVPISIAGWIIAFLILRHLFASALGVEHCPALAAASVRPTAVQGWILVLLFAVLGSYPVVAAIDPAAIWMVSSAGALVAMALASRQRDGALRELVMRGIAWEVLIFLLAVFVIAMGLRNVGLVHYLSALYEDAGIGLVGITAAFGSALLNNHPMAIMNLLALDGASHASNREVLAALIGGDLGPRLLPIGSLAGLLWLESCRQLGVEISLRQFVRVGFAVTVPTLVVSLAILAIG